MIPLKDNIRAVRRPVVNYALIGFTALVFLLQFGGEDSQLVERYGMIPKRVFHPDERVPIAVAVDRFRDRVVYRPAEETPFTPWLTLLTCIFLHGGWLHFLGNMWILWIFGDNVEDRLGKVGYLAFYVACGVAASATHLLTNAGSTIPTIGASGAIAGVMGAYFVLFPHSRVLTLVPIFFYVEIMVLPAPIFLGLWFVLQFVQGIGSIGAVQTGGVAWWAHIGGFVVGVVVAFVLRSRGTLSKRPIVILPGSDRRVYRRYGRW
jgi:hypothetical protein